MPQSDDIENGASVNGLDANEGVRFAQKDFFLDHSDRSMLASKMMMMNSFDSEQASHCGKPKKSVRFALAPPEADFSYPLPPPAAAAEQEQ